jgi:hypothetical protein
MSNQNPKYPSQNSPSAIAAQFSVTPTTNHRHTGLDSPKVNYTDILNTPTIPTTVPITLGSYSPAAAGTATIDVSVTSVNQIQMPAGNITIALANVEVGQVFTILITQDSVGSRTVSWFSTILWPQGITPTLTTTALKTDIFVFVCSATGDYFGVTASLDS